MKTIYKKRLWLNKSLELSAYITSYVKVDKDSHYPSIDASVEISDCTHNIYLEFDISKSSKSDAWFKERIAKLDRIIKVLTETKAAMLEAKVEFDKITKKPKKKLKKK